MCIHSYSLLLAVFLTQNLKYFLDFVYNKRKRDKTFLCIRIILAVITMRKRTSSIAPFQKAGRRKLASRCHQNYARLVDSKQWASYFYQIIRESNKKYMSCNRDNRKSPVHLLVCNISSSQIFRILLYVFNTLNAELNPIYHFMALLWAHPILHISGVRVKSNLPFVGIIRSSPYSPH